MWLVQKKEHWGRLTECHVMKIFYIACLGRFHINCWLHILQTKKKLSTYKTYWSHSLNSVVTVRWLCCLVELRRESVTSASYNTTSMSILQCVLKLCSFKPLCKQVIYFLLFLISRYDFLDYGNEVIVFCSKECFTLFDNAQKNASYMLPPVSQLNVFIAHQCWKFREVPICGCYTD